MFSALSSPENGIARSWAGLLVDHGDRVFMRGAFVDTAILCEEEVQPESISRP
jgi:hypothetical protein